LACYINGKFSFEEVFIVQIQHIYYAKLAYLWGEKHAFFLDELREKRARNLERSLCFSPIKRLKILL